MIEDAINSVLAGAWEKIVYYATFSFLDPFWGWLAIGLCIIAVVVAICWFFGGLHPAIKAVGGVIVLLVTAMLYAYRRGEVDAREHDRKKRPRR